MAAAVIGGGAFLRGVSDLCSVGYVKEKRRTRRDLIQMYVSTLKSGRIVRIVHAILYSILVAITD